MGEDIVTLTAQAIPMRGTVFMLMPAGELIDVGSMGPEEQLVLLKKHNINRVACDDLHDTFDGTVDAYIALLRKRGG